MGDWYRDTAMFPVVNIYASPHLETSIRGYEVRIGLSLKLKLDQVGVTGAVVDTALETIGKHADFLASYAAGAWAGSFTAIPSESLSLHVHPRFILTTRIYLCDDGQYRIYIGGRKKYDDEL